MLCSASKQLESVSDSAQLDAELLLSHCLGKDRTFLYTWPERTIDKEQLVCFEKLVDKRLTDYPIAYILGEQEFWSLKLKVTPDVLIPRPETELLVETALEKIKDIAKPKILDLGTGTGAIALALATERKDAMITATDFSIKALDVAKQNAENLGFSEQIQFIQSDWFTDIPQEKYDLIVSNPPYIANDDPHLTQSIRHEPMSALVSKNSGLEDIEKIISGAKNYLEDSAWLLLEHGFEQADQSIELLKKQGYTDLSDLKDYHQNPRVSLARLAKT